MQKSKSPLTIIDKISTWSGKILSFLLLVMTAIVVFEVIMRYAFNAPTIWVNELSSYLLVAMGFLAGAWVLFNDEHVNVDIIRRRFSPRKGAIVDLVTYLFFFLFVGIMLWQGSRLTGQSIAWKEHSDSAWAPYLWPIKLTIPVGAGLILLQGLAKYIRIFRFAVTGKEGTK